MDTYYVMHLSEEGESRISIGDLHYMVMEQIEDIRFTNDAEYRSELQERWRLGNLARTEEAQREQEELAELRSIILDLEIQEIINKMPTKANTNYSLNIATPAA